MRFLIFLIVILCFFGLSAHAQQKSDFQRMRIEKETWTPIMGLVNGKFTPSFLKKDSFDPAADSLVIMQEILVQKTSESPIKKSPENSHDLAQDSDPSDDNSESDSDNFDENYSDEIYDNQDVEIENPPTLGTGSAGSEIPFEPHQRLEDSLTFARIYAQDKWDAQPVDFTVHKSLMREDTTNLYDVEFENIVTVSEELSIDCVWVTLTKYYAVWNSEQINPYRYNISDFKDTIPMQLYDTTKNQGWSMPLADIRVTSMFGFRRYRWHHGIDLDLDTGDPVYASFDGIVRISRYNSSGYGNFVVLRHYNGLETLYGHLSESHVEVGQFLKAGDEIGKGGSTGRSTGPHLHYEVRYRGYALDPREIYDFENQRMKTDLFYLKPAHFKHLQTQRQTVWHTIRSGESLYKIAVRYRTTVYNLCKLNGISSKSTLRVGKKLRVK